MTFVLFFLIVVLIPVCAIGGVRLVERGDARRLRHRKCLAEIDRLERELGIAGKTPYEPSIRYLGKGQFMATGGNGTTISQFPVPTMQEIGRSSRSSGRREYLELLDEMTEAIVEAKPHFLEYLDGAEVDLDRDLQPKPPRDPGLRRSG